MSPSHREELEIQHAEANHSGKTGNHPLSPTSPSLIVPPVQQAPAKVIELKTKLQNVMEPALQGWLVDWMETVLVSIGVEGRLRQ
jgi:hypothetical protein